MGDKSPMQLDTTGVAMKEIKFNKGSFDLEMQSDKYYSIYLIEGIIETDQKLINENDFVLIENETTYHFNAVRAGKMFLIESPVKTGYPTYAERYL